MLYGLLELNRQKVQPGAISGVSENQKILQETMLTLKEHKLLPWV